MKLIEKGRSGAAPQFLTCSSVGGKDSPAVTDEGGMDTAKMS